MVATFACKTLREVVMGVLKSEHAKSHTTRPEAMVSLADKATDSGVRTIKAPIAKGVD